MIFWLIRFDVSEHMPETEHGYQVMNEADMVAVGVYDLNGNRVNGGVNYTTIDTSPELPAWADNV